MITQTELKAYLSTLDQSLQDVYEVADEFVKEMEDTLDENFQVASDLMGIFWKRCQQREGTR